jgi:hypothetical protein
MGMSVLEQVEASGRTQAMREALETVLRARFGTLPAEIAEAVAVADPATLQGWLHRAATAASLDEVGILTSETKD